MYKHLFIKKEGKKERNGDRFLAKNGDGDG